MRSPSGSDCWAEEGSPGAAALGVEVDSASIQVNRPRRRANTDVIPAQASALVIPAQASLIVIPAKAGIQRGDGLDPGFRRGDEEWAVG
jgi:hypothetical protein